MLKPKLLFIIMYVNVCVKRVYPQLKKNPITFCSVTEQFRKVNFPSHLNHMRSLIVLSTKVNNLPF